MSEPSASAITPLDQLFQQLRQEAEQRRGDHSAVVSKDPSVYGHYRFGEGMLYVLNKLAALLSSDRAVHPEEKP